MYGALTYTICMYVNMGVKRSVKTSGMQPTIVDILQKCIEDQKLKYLVNLFFRISFVYFLILEAPLKSYLETQDFFAGSQYYWSQH